MKASRLFVVPFIILSLAALACASLPSFTIPSLSTATARAALTATVEAGGDYALSSGLTIGSEKTLQAAIDAQAPLLENFAKETYQPEELSQAGHTYTYTVTLDKEQTVIWQTNWCTNSADILQQNLDHLQLRFTADKQVIDSSHIGMIDTRSGDLYCRYFTVALSNWPKGETVLTIEVNFTDKINDGMSDYPKGLHTYKYTVTLK